MLKRVSVSARILVVDDEPAYTRLIRLILSRNCGYEVLEENDSTRAVDTADAFQPDVILLDVVMPGIDGGEVANQILSLPRLTDVPIVFVSAIAMADAGKHGVTANLKEFPFYSKPVRMEKLLACIARFLRPVASTIGATAQ